MGNPYAARVSRQTSQPESLSELEQFVRRLRVIGATDEEVQAVRATWDDLDEDYTARDRYRVAHLPDAELRLELLATRGEYQHDTTDEHQQAAIDTGAYQAQVAAWAADVVRRPVGEILKEVGDDGVRAIAVLDLELGPNGAKRKTLVGPLRELVAGDDPAGIPVEFVGERTG